MGNESSNSPGPSPTAPSQQSPIESLIDSTFQSIKSNQISRSEFNQAIKIFEVMNYISLCNSHLAARLFEILEPNAQGRLEKSFVAEKLKKLIRDPSKANRCKKCPI